MESILLVVQIIVALLLVTVILLQNSSADSLKGLGGGSNMNVVSQSTTSNFLTKTTIFLAIVFMVNSLVLANISSKHNRHASIVEKIKHKDLNTVPLAE